MAFDLLEVMYSFSPQLLVGRGYMHRLVQRTLVIGVSVLCLGVAPSAFANSFTLDQSVLFPSPIFAPGTNPPTTTFAQTYTAGLTGILAGINLPGQNASATTETFTISINTVSGGFPTSTVLGSTTNTVGPGGLIPLSQLFIFPQAIAQVAGTQYAIVVSLPLGATAGGLISISNPYAGGMVFNSFDGGSTWSPPVPGLVIETEFQTFVATPEPGSLVLLASGLAGLAGMIRRRARF
jgi:hypothetical protein